MPTTTDVSSEALVSAVVRFHRLSGVRRRRIARGVVRNVRERRAVSLGSGARIVRDDRLESLDHP